MFKSIQDLVKKNYLSCDVADVLREKGINKLTPLQKRVFNDENFWYDGTKDKNGNMIIQGSTSSGKKLVAEISIIDVLTKSAQANAIYLVPLRAMATEKYREFDNIMGKTLGWNVFPSSSDHQLHDGRILDGDYHIAVIVYEKFFALLAQDAGKNFLKNCELIVVDELQMLDTPERGPKLEVALTNVRQSKPNIRIIGLTTVYCNMTKIAAWFNCTPIIEKELSIPLEEYVVNTDGKIRGQLNPAELDFYADAENVEEKNVDISKEDRIEVLKKRRDNEIEKMEKRNGESLLYEDLETLDLEDYNIHRKIEREARKWNLLLNIIKKCFSEQESDGVVQKFKVIVFTNSRKKTENLALLTAKNGILRNEGIDPKLAGKIEQLDSDEKKELLVKELLPYGIAFHNAGLPLKLRKFVEEEFSEGTVNLLFATETLSIGLNMPADYVILESTRIQRGEYEEEIKSYEYKNFIGRAGRLGVSMSKKGCSYLLATDRRGMADYWKRYVTAGNMEINSAFSRLDILKQAPFMLNSFVGKKGESISEHDAATFLNNVVIKKNYKEDELKRVLIEMQDAKLMRKSAGLIENKGYQLTSFGNAMAQFALSLTSCKIINNYFCACGGQINDGYPGGMPANYSANDLRKEKYILDILYLVCQMEEVARLSPLQAPLQGQYNYGTVYNQIRDYIERKKDMNELWENSGLNMFLEDDYGREDSLATPALRAILLEHWTRGELISEIKKETKINVSIATADMERLAEIVSFILDAISKGISTGSARLGKEENPKLWQPIERGRDLQTALYHFSNRVKYGMDDELVQMANCHIIGVSRDALIRAYRNLNRNTYSTMLDFVKRGTMEQLRILGPDSVIKELREALERKYTGLNIHRVIEEMKKDNVIEESILQSAENLLSQGDELIAFTNDMRDFLGKCGIKLATKGIYAGTFEGYVDNIAAMRTRFRFILSIEDEGFGDTTGDLLGIESKIESNIHETQNNVIIISKYGFKNKFSDDIIQRFGENSRILWFDLENFIYLVLYTMRFGDYGVQTLAQILNDQTGYFTRSSNELVSFIDNYGKSELTLPKSAVDFFLLYNQESGEVFIENLLNSCEGRLNCQKIKWGMEKEDYVETVVMLQHPIVIYVDSENAWNSQFFRNQMKSIAANENMFEMAYIIYRESKVKEKTLEMFPSFKNIKNVLRQDVNLEKIVGEIENKTRKKSILDENRKDVFLSYNQHSKYADKIVEALEKRNLSVFRDTAEIRCGNNVVSKINEGLTKAKSILILLDDEYVNGSNWTRRELEVATIFSIEGGTVFLVVADDNEDFIENYPLLKPLCCGKLGKDMKELDDIVRDISEQLK